MTKTITIEKIVSQFPESEINKLKELFDLIKDLKENSFMKEE